jgi:hypothetical protein
MPELEADQPLIVTSPRRRHEFFPGELKAMQVGRHGVVHPTRVERKATIEPPAVHARAVPLAKLPYDRHQIAGQPRLVRCMIADSVLPCRVVSMIAGVIVVKDEMHLKGVAGIGQIPDQVTHGCASRRYPIDGPAGCRQHLQCVARREDDVLCSGLARLLHVPFCIKVAHRFLKWQPVIFADRLRLSCPMRGNPKVT